MRIFIKISVYVLLIVNFNNHLYAQVSDFKAIDFTRADNIARLHKGAPIANLPLLVHQLTYSLPTDVEKFRAIYVWVCENIAGDNVQHQKVSNKRRRLKNNNVKWTQWNTEYKRIAFKKLRKHKKTMCTGYAYLIKELCFLANIESVIIDGYGRSVEANVTTLEIPNHSWNAVRLHNKWYVCDATWSSGYMDETNMFIKEYNNGYFLTDPILFGKNHFPLVKKWTLHPEVTKTSFTEGPMVYGKAFEHHILPISPQNIETTIHKNDNIRFRFKTSQNITKEDVSLVIYIINEEKKLTLTDFQNQNGVVSFDCSFKNKGTYDTHLKINDDIVTSYTISVVKSEKTSVP